MATSVYDLCKRLKRLELCPGTDSDIDIFDVATYLAKTRPVGRSAVLQSMHNMLADGLLISTCPSTDIHTVKHNPDNAQPSTSNPELVNCASSLHIANGNIVTSHTVDKNRSCSATMPVHPVPRNLASHSASCLASA